MRVQSQIKRFLDQITGEHYAANTLIAYQADLVQLLDYLTHHAGEPTAWDQVSEQDIIGYLLYLREREYAPSTVSRKMATISSFFRFLLSQRVIASDPTRNISVPNVARVSSEDMPSDEDVDQLWAHITADPTPKGLRDRMLLGLMVQAGYRPSELIALNLEDVATLSTQLAAHGRMDLRAALEQYVADGRSRWAPEGEPALFLSVGVGAGGGRLTRQGVWLIVKERARACGLEGRASPRSLRRLHLASKQVLQRGHMPEQG